MEFFLLDPQVARLPSEETRFLDLRAEPYPDGKRVRVNLELTPFLHRPEIELTLTDPTGQTFTSATVIETAGRKLEHTLHIRTLSGAKGRTSQGARDTSHSARGTFTLAAHLPYPDLGEIYHREATIDLPPPQNK
jgi:hypothetical protein